jgi:hypothetical protein
MITLKNLHRRTFLRGMLNGSAVLVALPLLDVVLDPHGEVVAKTGLGSDAGSSSQGLPVCFGTWYWPLGLSWKLWEPKETDTANPSNVFSGTKVVDGKPIPVHYAMNEHLQALAPIMGKFNIFSGAQVMMDGKTIIVHYSPVQAQYTGIVSTGETPDTYGRSFDQDIAEFFGAAGVVFPSITVTADGNSRGTWSSPGPSTGMNPPELSPLALYTKMFGPSFVDPNAAVFHPNPTVMVRDSVLSAVSDQRQSLMKLLPASDRARLDAYFTSLRDLENQLHTELQKPKPLPACTKPAAPQEHVSTDIVDVARTHHLFVQLQAHAFSCGLTRVWNTSATNQQPPVHKAGDPVGNHEHTHEDPVDAKTQYQPTVKWFCDQWLSMFTDLVKTLDSVKEGKGTLLDRVLIMGVTDHGNARQHSVTEIPMLTAGFANGRVRNGLHVSAPGASTCRLGLTCQQAMGMPIGSWGTESNNTSQPFSEILV